ncbi:DUF86 domain-containing protein [Gleimia hominis]|uniref:DUF86 domain-containing protein n=1 Tax=Gleimia hominis TaxID=595468 RepID=A0ABU3I8X5_9ACTO|nr:HepT-like ribonuclease domain-containing protein [Gleimia hominis]MDT3766819.1 DUF86 domain-containing protein [Gleimia hominis]
MKKSNLDLIEEAITNISLINEYTKSGFDNPIVFDAVALRIAVLIDTLSKLDSSLRKEVTQDNWAAIRGMRNRIVHAYTGVDHAIVKATVSNDLPILEQSLKRAKTRLGESPQD